MRSWLADPLLHFVLLGFILFVVVDLLAPEQLTTDSSIIVNQENLVEYLQFQRKSFNVDNANQLFEAMPRDDRERLISNYIRDEALYREALAMGMDDNDEVIRRRLIQKVEYLAQGFYDSLPPITSSDLAVYFEQNIDRYEIAAAITFTHIFIQAEPDSIEDAGARAMALRKELNDKAVGFDESGEYGDRYLYNRNYVERTRAYIDSHFGKKFGQHLFSLKAAASWQGPLQSAYGMHLVMIKDFTPARRPQLSEVAGIVLADAQREQQQSFKASAIAELVNKYPVILQLPAAQ